MDDSGHITLFIAMGVGVAAMATLFLNFGSKYLSIREHETYNEFIKRELDLLKERLNVLEQTRPTTGELAAKLGKIKPNDSCKGK